MPYAGRYRKTVMGKGPQKKERKKSPAPARVPLLKDPVSVVIAGSAGERIQSSAGLLCQVALDSGLFVTQKNDNPVTQGTGFSLSELWISPRPVGFTGIEQPDVLLVASEDGFRELKNQGWFNRLGKNSEVYLDESIAAEMNTRQVVRVPFRKAFGAKAAAMGALLTLAHWKRMVDPEKILESVTARYGDESARVLKEGIQAILAKDRNA